MDDISSQTAKPDGDESMNATTSLTCNEESSTCVNATKVCAISTSDEQAKTENYSKVSICDTSLADDNVNANASDQGVKIKLKSLESETEQRNTSTSNAGESEYESANEEDIADFENSDQAIRESKNSAIASDKTSIEAKPSADDNTVESKDAILRSTVENGEQLSTLNNSTTYSKISEIRNEQEKNLLTNEEDGDSVDQQIFSKIRRRKKLDKLSDDEKDANDDDFDDVDSDEDDETENIEDEDEEDMDSFDEAEDGQVDELIDDNKNSALPEDERENGDGQESENQDKSAKVAASGKAAKKADVEDRRNPQYIPRKGPFYEHDDRNGDPGALAPSKGSGEGDENDVEKGKAKKKLMASMKLRSDDMIDEDLDVEEQLSNKSVSKEKLHDTSIAAMADGVEKVIGNAKVDVKSPNGREISRKSHKPIWDSKDRWSHDKYNVDDQKPKSREELINSYGYDIRNETEAPRLLRRSKYGKGPSKYVRRSEDENAYAKKALRKVISRSSPSQNSLTMQADSEKRENRTIERESREADFAPVPKKDQVFNNRYPEVKPKDSKPISKEFYLNPRPMVNNSNNNKEFSNRVQENRVFTNKSGQSSKYDRNKGEKHHRFGSELGRDDQMQNDIVEDSLRRKNVTDSKIEDFADHRSKELFTSEDFPELVSTSTSSAKTSHASADVSHTPSAIKSNKPHQQQPPHPPPQAPQQHQQQSSVIYYQQSSAPIKFNDTKSSKDTHHAAQHVFESKDISLDSDVGKNQPLTVVKSQFFENSRFSRQPRNFAPNSEKSSNAPNWNNNRPINANKPSQPSFAASNISLQSKKPPSVVSTINKEDSSSSMQMTENNEPSGDSRPKRYSSIRQQRTLTMPPNNSNNSNPPPALPPPALPPVPQSQPTSLSHATKSQFTAVSQAAALSQPYTTLSAESTNANPSVTPVDVASAKSSPYFDQSALNTNEIIGHNQSTPNILPAGNAANHQHQSAHNHNYASLNGGANRVAAGPTNGPSYISTAAPLMAYYDPAAVAAAAAAAAAANGPTASTATSGLQAPIGITQAYFAAADQSGATQTAPNYYLTTADLAAVAYHPAYHLPANYASSPLPAHHHTHQSHVSNRYLNTTPQSAQPSTEPNRYLQTTVPPAAAAQNSAQILVAAAGGQAYQTATMHHQTAFPSGYPQFPPPAQSNATAALGTTASPLPAGYPNVQITSSNSSSSSNSTVPVAQQQTPSGYPELYRGGITYYDIQSQQQAMQRHMQQHTHQLPQQTQQPPQQQQQVRRTTKSGINLVNESGGELDEHVEVNDKSSKHTNTKSEISVSN